MTTYTPIFDKAVYGTDSEADSDKGKIPVKLLFLPKRYTEPTEDQVVAYLQQKAASLDAAASLVIPETARRKGRSHLEEAVMALPDEIRHDLKSGDEACAKFIRRNTLAPEVQVGGQYLFVRHGLLITEMLQVNQEAGHAKEVAWYDAALSDKEFRESGLGERWNMKILLEEGKLPDRNEMNLLLKHGVHGSATLEISRTKYPRDQVREIVDFLYDNFSTPEQIAQLRDVSDEVLDEYSIPPIFELLKKVQQNALTQQLIAKQLQQGAKPGNGKRLIT